MPSKTYKWSYIVVCILFFSYVLLRAINVGLTIDEGGTIRFMVPYIIATSANNHVLNTLLIKILFLFNDSLFSARLPNVVAFGIYLFFSYKIVVKYLPAFLGLICFILLCCNPFMLEFFSLARGYGLSLACMMAALYYGLELLKQYSISTLTNSLIWASVSVLAIFSNIYFLGVWFVALNVLCYLTQRSLFTKTIKRSLWIGFMLFLLIIYYLVRLIKFDELYYGGKNNIIADSFTSLVHHSLYSPANSTFTEIVLYTALIVWIIVVVVSYLYNKRIASAKNVIVFTLLGSITFIILTHYIAGVNYPLERNSLFFYPLFVLSFCFCLADMRKSVHQPIISILAFFVVYNFILHMNVSRTELWGFDAHTTTILQKINEEGKRTNSIVTVKVDWLFNESFSHYTKGNRFPYVRLRETIAVNGAYEKMEAQSDIDYYVASPSIFSDYDKDVFLDYTQDNLIVYTNVHLRE